MREDEAPQPHVDQEYTILFFFLTYIYVGLDSGGGEALAFESSGRPAVAFLRYSVVFRTTS